MSSGATLVSRRSFGPMARNITNSTLPPTAGWAAYRFTSYRSGKTLPAIPTPDIAVHSEPGRYSLQASLNLDSLSHPDQSLWHLGLSAVMEDKSGRLSYWALAHPTDKPDFHRPE